MTTAFLHHLRYDFRTGLRDKSLLLMNYLFPLAFYAMMGALMTRVNPTFAAVLIPAMIVNAIMASGLLGLPAPLVSARETGVLRSYHINGVPALSILIIPILGVALHMLIVTGVITLTAQPLFGGQLPANVPAFLLVTLAAIFAINSLGALIGVIAENSRATVLFSQLFYLPSMILGGLMLPSEMIPDGLRKIALLLPASHVMNAYRGLAFGEAVANPPALSLLALAAGGVIALGLAVALFQWDGRLGRRRSPALAVLALLPYLATVLLFR